MPQRAATRGIRAGLLSDRTTGMSMHHSPAPTLLIASEARIMRIAPPLSSLRLNHVCWSENPCMRRFDSVPVSPVAAHTPRRRVERARIDLGAPQPSDLEIIRYASREARRAILSDPAAFISRIPTRLFDMWNPTSFLLRHLQIGTYAEVPGWLAVPISSLAVLAYLLVVALACVGLVLGRRRPETWLVVLIVAGFSAITAVSFGLTHLRLLLMLLAAGACIRWLPRAGGSPRVAASVALTVVSLGLSGCGRSDEAERGEECRAEDAA